MKLYPILAFAVVVSAAMAQQPSPERPKAGAAPIMKASEIKPGMKGTAWTVFAGTEPEPIPVEIVGLLKNAWGPKQDIILAKMTGKAERTNVAGGMSGSPVYVDGKLIGAVALRMSVFSPDAICGITPIELMLEINDYDQSRPANARVPDTRPEIAELRVPDSLLPGGARLTAIDTPLTFSGFDESTLREFAPMFRQMGVAVAQGGAGAALHTAKPVSGWQDSLRPGDAVSGVLVSGDVSVTVMGTTTYNDGKRVLAFGHPFLNLGPVSMPMAKSEVVMTLASAFQPNKFGNATDIVGTLRQDRHSGVMGLLGEEAEVIPVRMKLRTFDENERIVKDRDLNFQVFVHQRWTPFLMMLTMFNSIQGLNDFADDVTYRISGNLQVEGQPNVSLSAIHAPSEVPIPPPLLMAGWWADKFNRLFLNAIDTPRLKGVDATIDLLPKRRVAIVESAWAAETELAPGEATAVKVFLRPYRGDRIEKEMKISIPAGFPKGDHRILFSDADTLNRMQAAAGMMNRFIDLSQTVSLLNQERSNNQLYVSLVQSAPTVYYEDKTMPNLPASVANVMQNGRQATRPMFTAPETAVEQSTIPFEQQITGSYSLRIRVK